MDYQETKVIMTGGSGPVGLALINKLLKEKVEILLLQREESLRREMLPDHDLLHIEFCDLENLKKYNPSERGYDVFFHLGWTNTVKEKRKNLKLQSENVAYSCEAVELAHRCGCHTFIGAGSQAEYGRHEAPLRPDSLCMPESAYGVMKLCACHSTRLICREYGIRHIWPRILSGYGINDNENSVLIATILNSIKGKPLEFSMGEQIWDFVHMDDIADALFLIAKKGKNGVNYPIGSGEARPLKVYLSILCEKLGVMSDIEFGKIPYEPYQVMHLEADISRLQADTGWKPQISFEEGIIKVIDFYKQKFYRSKLKE